MILVQFGDAFVNPEEVAALAHSDYSGKTRIDLRSGAHLEVAHPPGYVARRLISSSRGYLLREAKEETSEYRSTAV